MILIIPVLIKSVYTDIKTGKIKNKLIFIAMLLGIMLDFVTGGVETVIDGVKMGCLIIALLYALFLIGGLGAGDIKLLALIGLLFPKHVIMITVLSFVIAGVAAAIRIIIRLIKKEKAFLKGDTLHFSVPVAIAFTLVMCWLKE